MVYNYYIINIVNETAMTVFESQTFILKIGLFLATNKTLIYK